FVPLLPLTPAATQGEAKGGTKDTYIFEPAEQVLLADLLPRLVTLQVFRSLLENAVGEHSARMTAMDNATKNTKELISSLTLTMNRARQAAITRELIEILSGAEALNGQNPVREIAGSPRHGNAITEHNQKANNTATIPAVT